MTDLTRLCFSCMNEKDENGICPHCGHDGMVEQLSPLLPLGAVVNGRYYIGKAIRINDEGFTYMAYDIELDSPCTVREFFPGTLAQRDADEISVIPTPGCEISYSQCLKEFYELWTKLMRLKGLTALITVYEVLELNTTCYAVYEDMERMSLREYLLNNGTGYIAWDQARILFMPVLSTLGTLHTSGIIHRGLNPSAFFFSEDGRLKISDFSTDQLRLAYGELDAEIPDGYAPTEIYQQDGDTGPWTDVYSFTAVLFRSLIGSTPIDAPTRLKNDQMMIPAKFAEQLPPYVINAIINGMQLNPEDRTRNIEQLRSNLSASPRAVSASASVYNTVNEVLKASSDNGVTAPARRQPVTATAKTEKESTAQTAAKGAAQSRKPASSAAYNDYQKKAQTRKKLTYLLIAILVILLIGIGLIVSALVKNGGTTQPDTTASAGEMLQVPNFTGKDYNAIATDQYFSTAFHIVKVEEFNSTVPQGQVLSQSALPNTQIARGSDIILYVSAGPKNFAVPDVAGQTYEQALTLLAQQGLVCTKASKYNDGTHIGGTVAETFPAAGSRIVQGESISIIIWSEPEASTIPEATAPTVPVSQTPAPTMANAFENIFQ